MRFHRSDLTPRCVRYLIVTAVFSMCVVSLTLLAGIATLAQTLDPRCSDRSATGSIVCVINRPAVNAHETRYPLVQFAPGDIVDVTADGCVQTGGAGDTWKRYVNPTGGESDTLYHGLIRIPSATPVGSGLVRIASVIGHRQKVTGAGIDVSQLVLHLGYDDDDYSDNGYYRHDNGNEDQCKNDRGHGGPAQVRVTIYRGVIPRPPTSRFDFDVLADAVDPNGLPFNPQWSWQRRAANAGQVPDTSICHNFSARNTVLGIPQALLTPNFPDCTDQTDPTNVDLPNGLNAEICNVGGIFKSDSFSGHLNWFPVTLEGRAGWGGEETDDDNSFTFTSDRPGHPLGVAGHEALHVEFDSDETTKHFASDEWTTFHNWVNTNNDDLARQLFNGHTIVTGMFGLDGEHNLKSELHPLFALATRRDNYGSDATHEDWLMFVRNRGDEGLCSSRLWDAGFEDYTFALPWPTGMRAVDVNWAATQFEGTAGTSGPSVLAVPWPRKGAGVYVTFHLGPAANAPFIDGSLKLVWTPGVPVLHARPPIAHQFAARLSGPATEPENDEAEHTLAATQARLTTTQRAAIRAASAEPARVTHRLARGASVRVLATQPSVRALRRPDALDAGPATAKLQRDAARMRVMCTATGNAPRGLRAAVCVASARVRKAGGPSPRF